MTTVTSFERDDLLIVVDMQKDFVTGSLAVPNALRIVPAVNINIGQARRHAAHIAYSMCFHKSDHPSFIPQGGPWPPHCVMGTKGQELVDDLDQAIAYEKRTRVLKGYDTEAYSAFDGTNFHTYLKWQRVQRVFVCGLALDYCVLQTALDAKKLGYAVAVIMDATAGVAKHSTEGAMSSLTAHRIELCSMGWIK